MNIEKLLFTKKQIAMFMAGFSLALASGLGLIEGGDAFTIGNVFDVPLITWAGAIGAGITSAIGIDKKE